MKWLFVSIVCVLLIVVQFMSTTIIPLVVLFLIIAFISCELIKLLILQKTLRVALDDRYKKIHLQSRFNNGGQRIVGTVSSTHIGMAEHISKTYDFTQQTNGVLITFPYSGAYTNFTVNLKISDRFQFLTLHKTVQFSFVHFENPKYSDEMMQNVYEENYEESDEIYALRTYIEGERMSNVHWKFYEKFDELLVWERKELKDDVVVIDVQQMPTSIQAYDQLMTHLYSSLKQVVMSGKQGKLIYFNFYESDVFTVQQLQHVLQTVYEISLVQKGDYANVK